MAKSDIKPFKDNEEILVVTRRPGNDYGAVFRKRSDGDWEFIALCYLDEGAFPTLSQADDDQAMALLLTIAGGITSDGDRALIDFFGDPDCPAVYEKDVTDYGQTKG